MPFDVEAQDFAGTPVEVMPSAVLELTWLAYPVHEKHRALAFPAGLDAFEAAIPGLREEMMSLWGDGHTCLPDTSVLAERIGALLLDQADPFLQGLERAALIDGTGLELRSETPEIRRATVARLERLRADADLRRRYADLLTRIWELVRPQWDTVGLAAVRQACAAWSDELRHGAQIVDLLGPRHIARKPHFQPLLELRPRIVASPMYFAGVGGFVIDMTCYLHLGAPARRVDADELSRKEAELVASRLKVLADGTRVALLRQLAREPASVMDLARRFRLAQPTVSNHVRLLRDADLLDSRRDGARVLYTASRERVGRLLGETEHLLLEH